MNSSNYTHFGFQQVPTEEKAKHVNAVFTSVAESYDIMNDLLSFGLHRLWKRFAIALLPVRPGHYVLDLAGGTGDLTALIAPKTQPRGQVVLADINEAMLRRGRDRLLDRNLVQSVQYSLANAEALPFAEGTFDYAIMGFGLRNVTHKDRALKSIFRVLKPGGMVLILEFSHPNHAMMKSLYDFYSFKVMPKIGEIVANDAESYRYLAESIRMHPKQSELQAMMEAAGFERCNYLNLSGGIVAIHRGYKI